MLANRAGTRCRDRGGGHAPLPDLGRRGTFGDGGTCTRAAVSFVGVVVSFPVGLLAAPQLLIAREMTGTSRDTAIACSRGQPLDPWTDVGA